MEGNEAAASENVEGAQKNMGWDTDNVRLGIFMVLFAIWAPMQFVPLVGDTYCKGKDALYNFTFPTMLLALFLSRKRTPEVLNRLGYLTVFSAGIGFVYIISDHDQQLQLRFHLPFLAGAFYFVKQRSSAEHIRNMVLGLWIFLIIILTMNPHNPDFYVAITACSVGYIILKYKEGLLRPALFLLMLITAHEGWSHIKCPGIYKPWCNSAKSDLANMAFAEEDYFRIHEVYTRNLENLASDHGFKKSGSVYLLIRQADEKSFRAMAVHPLCDQNEDGAPDFFYWDSSNGGMQLF